MFERTAATLTAVVHSLFVASCTTKTETKAPADKLEGRVTVYVEGMKKVQGIT